MASSPQINAFNEQLRASPAYAAWMRAQGIDPSKPIKLSDAQRKAFAAYLGSQGMALPPGAEVDASGNANENEGFGKQLKKWGPIAGGAALAAFGIPGVMPGLFSGGGGAGWVGSQVGKVAAAAGGAGGGTGVGMGLGASDWLSAALFGGQTLANVWGTKQQNKATDRAADAQLQANREALDFLKQQWETARADFQPYLNLGHAATGRLNDYVTTTPSPTMPANLRQQMEGGYDPQTYTPRPNWTPPARPAPTTLAQFNQPNVLDMTRGRDDVFTTQPVPRPATGPQQQPMLTSGTPATLADFGRTQMAPPQTVAQTIRVQAPDGEIRDLPLVQAARALQLGARRVA